MKRLINRIVAKRQEVRKNGCSAIMGDVTNVECMSPEMLKFIQTANDLSKLNDELLMTIGNLLEENNELLKRINRNMEEA